MIKYNDDNIYVGQIKELLHSFNLPTCKVKKDSSKFYVGEYYIDKDLGGLYKVESVNEDKTLNESTLVQSYKFNDDILNITKHLEIRNNFYDSYTHTYLGNYLRFVRDYLDLDLMSMYNCFSNESPINLHIKIADKVAYNQHIYRDILVDSNDINYNIYMIPVKQDTTYTLAFDYENSFSIFYGFYDNNNYLVPGDNLPDDVSSIEASTFKTFGEIRFRKPKVIKTPSLNTENELRYENNLKLFIVLPNSFINNIVLIEGDYTKSVETFITQKNQLLGNAFFGHISEKFDDVDGVWYFNDVNTNISSITYPLISSCNFNEDDSKFYITFSNSDEASVEYISTSKLDGSNYDFISRLQLLEYSTSTKYLLADRLQEYLSNNVITHIDDIIPNIKRVQMKLLGYDSSFNVPEYGIWSDNINKWIYKYISTHGNSGDITFRDIYRDVLCFVDKDIESVINTLQIEELTEEQIEELSEKERSEYLTSIERQRKAKKVIDSLGGIYG